MDGDVDEEENGAKTATKEQDLDSVVKQLQYRTGSDDDQLSFDKESTPII